MMEMVDCVLYQREVGFLNMCTHFHMTSGLELGLQNWLSLRVASVGRGRGGTHEAFLSSEVGVGIY